MRTRKTHFDKKLYSFEHKQLMREAIDGLEEMLVQTAADGIRNVKDFKAWAKDHRPFLNETFQYQRGDDKPEIHSLFSPFYHRELPLIGLNYTPVAHNVLHAIPDGWTMPLRLCRGIVFDLDGNLVALPFRKFFNLGENQETMPDALPRGYPFDASRKMDGHLAIIFRYVDQILMTTRGSFDSPTGKIGNELLAAIVRKKSGTSLICSTTPRCCVNFSTRARASTFNTAKRMTALSSSGRIISSASTTTVTPNLPRSARSFSCR